MAGFTDATAVRPEGTEGAYQVDLDPQWTVGGKPNGGYLLATLARAALATANAADHPHPLAASAHYLSPPEVGPATVTVELLRAGRLATQLRTRLTQKDRACVEALFTVGRLRPGADAATRFVDAPPPALAPYGECPVTPIDPPGAGIRVEMLEMVEQRLDPASMVGAGGGSGLINGWIQFVDREPFDPVSLLYIADSFPPATLTLGSVGWAPTLELTVYVRGVPAPGPLRVRQRARILNGGLVDQVCEAWDTDDRVVLQATQLAAVRMR